MTDILPQIAELNIDAVLASLEGDAAPPASASPAAAEERAPAEEPPAAAHVPERRTAPRREPSEIAGDIRVTIPGIQDIVLINISETGVLIETRRALSPGLHTDLIVQLNGKRHVLRATSVRSTLHTITPASGTVYRTALRFDRRFALDGD